MGTACTPRAAPPPPSPPPRTLDAPAEPAIWCPGGLLCESTAPLAGWRVPVACEERSRGEWFSTCWVSSVPFDHLQEFFATRYADVQETPRGLRVVGAMPHGIGRAPPELHLTLMGGRYRLLALPGDGPAEAPRPPGLPDPATGARPGR